MGCRPCRPPGAAAAPPAAARSPRAAARTPRRCRPRPAAGTATRRPARSRPRPAPRRPRAPRHAGAPSRPQLLQHASSLSIDARKAGWRGCSLLASVRVCIFLMRLIRHGPWALAGKGAVLSCCFAVWCTDWEARARTLPVCNNGGPGRGSFKARCHVGGSCRPRRRRGLAPGRLRARGLRGVRDAPAGAVLGRQCVRSEGLKKVHRPCRAIPRLPGCGRGRAPRAGPAAGSGRAMPG
jgi:hypothetical protein